jgi:hypothetical protein
MKKQFTLYLLLLVSITTYSQEPTARPTAAPQPTSFLQGVSSSASAMNTISLQTGEVTFPITLLSLPQARGFAPGISISYNSNVTNQVNTRNLESQSGPVGLGWTLDVPSITCNHRGTGTREDDEFFLSDGGKLINIGSDQNEKSYTVASGQLWKIKYFKDKDMWHVIKEDGTLYVYGGNENGTNSIEYLVRWGNWIGNSSQINGQSLMSYQWNLSFIINQWGESIRYDYIKDENSVGNGGNKHTEACYLKRITDAMGRKIELFYDYKSSYFYSEPHIEQEEPDAYQEFYEKRYLSRLEAWGNSDNPASLYQSAYLYYDQTITKVDDGAKMLLSKIEVKNKLGQALSPTSFSYYDNNTPNTGRLKTVIYPTGGTVTYQYASEGVILGHSNRQFTANAPMGYAEPKIWIQDDYVVIAWRKLSNTGAFVHDGTTGMDVVIRVYQWIGEWKEFRFDHKPIRNIKVGNEDTGNGHLNKDYRDFYVKMERDFFAILYHTGETWNDGLRYNLLLITKDKTRIGDWVMDDTNLGLDLGPKRIYIGQNSGKSVTLPLPPYLHSGHNFVSIKTRSFHNLYTYTYLGNSWRSQNIILPSTSSPGTYYGAAQNNFIWSHDEDNNPDGLYFSYLDESKNWNTKLLNSSVRFGSEYLGYWYSTDSFVLGMVKNNNEFFYHWDENYSNFTRYDVLGSLADESKVKTVGNNLISIYNSVPIGNKEAIFTRFDGKDWRKLLVSRARSAETSISEDLCMWDEENNGSFLPAYKLFNPNTLSWGTSQIFPTGGVSNMLVAGNNVFALGDKIYFRDNKGIINQPGPYPSAFNNRTSFSFGYFNFFTFVSVPWGQRGINTHIQLIKNGRLNTFTSLPNTTIYDRRDLSTYIPYQPGTLVGGYTFCTYPYADLIGMRWSNLDGQRNLLFGFRIWANLGEKVLQI